MAGAKKTAQKRADKRGDTTLLRRRIIATVALVLVAGFATMSAFVWTKDTKADTNFDPFFNLSTSSPKVRIFQPLQKSLDNPQSMVANGQAPANSTVTLHVDGNVVGSTTANDKGLWSRNISGLADGDHELTASATVNGPLSVVTSHNFAPGYGLLDLQTNALTSSYNSGITTIFFSATSQYGTDDTVGSYNVVAPENSQYVYIIRQRSVMIVDVTTQKPVKTINLGERFALGEGQYNNQTLKAVTADDARDSIYLLFSNSDSSQILTVSTATNNLVAADSFNPALQAEANRMVLAGGRLFVAKTGSNTVQVIDPPSNTSTDIALQNSLLSLAASADGSTVYAAETTNETEVYTISKIATADAGVESQVIDLGPSFAADGMIASPSGDTLYVLSTFNAEVRAFELGSNTQTASVDVNAIPQFSISTLKPIFNDDGSRMFVPLQDGRVAMVDTSNTSLVGHINLPSQSYSNLSGLMYYSNKVYTTYTRAFDPGDITNLSAIFSTVGVSNANSTTSVTPQTITSTGTTSTFISKPIAISPQTYTGASQFSVGTPLTITSPTTNESLDTSTPVIKGKGPKNKTIQLVVNTNTPIDVSVNAEGNWERQVTLPKDKFSKVTATYNNKRTQVVVPNHTILGASIAKSELSIIDGESALQQQGINLGDTGLQNIKLNNTAAINPNGQRYYLISNDATNIVSSLLGSLTSGDSSQIDFQALTGLLENTQIGSIGVYSSQTRQSVATIQFPNGMVPVGIAVSPDGKRAVVSVIDIPAELALLRGEEPIDEETPAPLSLFIVNLENNTIDGNKIQPNINLLAFAGGEVDPQQALQTYFSLASGVYFLSRPGSFNADGSKLYTSGFAAGKMSVIDVASRELSTIDLPNQYAYSVILNTQFNKTNGVLYATYLNVIPPEVGTDPPQITTGILLFNTQNNQIIGQSLLPNFPLFNFAVNPAGTKLYFITANVEDFIGALSSTDPNSAGLLANILPQFSIGTYDLSIGSYNTYPLTNTEVPISLALSSDGSRLYVPTIASNVVHVFDTVNNQVNPGNAPVILPGLSVMFGTGDFINDATIGAYTATGDYYVPADAPTTVPPGTTTVVQNNVGSTQFRYLPAAQQAAIVPQSISLPQQTVKTVQQTVERAAAQQKEIQTQKIQTTWLIYLFYAALLTVLTAIGVTVWRTDMVLGRSASDDLFA